MTKKETPKKNALVYLLFAFILILVFYSFKKNQDYNKLQSIFFQERKEMQGELDELIEDYKDLTIKRKDLSKRLVREMNKIISLRDSVKTLKVANYHLISKYRKKIKTLERENRDLFAKIDSLNIVTKFLEDKNLTITNELTKQQSENTQLSKTNLKLKKKQKELATKVAVAGVIKTSLPNAVVMKERSSGKLTTTSRSSRADAFKTTFKLLENKVTIPGKKKIHIQILDKNKNVIASKGPANLKDGSQIMFSDELIADYFNQEIDVLSLVLVNRDDINRGVYTIKTYVDGVLTGKTSVKLR